jgi:hypothetical protein
VSRQRKLLLIAFIILSVIGMVARYYNQNAERRRMERTLETLARVQREQRLYPTPTPTPADAYEETRDMFASDLPRESLEAIRQAVGQDFKLMDLRFANEMTVALRRGRKVPDGPSPVNVTGDSPLADSLYEPKELDLGLLAKLAQDAVARSGIEGGRVSSVRFAYEIIRYKGESPVWTFVVERGSPPDWAHKFVTYDAKGKFRSTF